MAGNCQVFEHQTLVARSRAPSPIWTHALRGFDPRSPLQPSLALRASYGLASQRAKWLAEAVPPKCPSAKADLTTSLPRRSRVQNVSSFHATLSVESHVQQPNRVLGRCRTHVHVALCRGEHVNPHRATL